MDSLTSARGRGRKRHTLPATSSTLRSSESAEQQSSSETPVASSASYQFTFETPSPSASRETRTRTRQVEGTNASPDDSAAKGGRSLRKRPRVDYTFDQLDDIENYSSKAASASTRSLKRRKTDLVSNENEITEDFEGRSKRRASEQPQPSSARRRNTRKSTAEPQVFVPEHQVDDVEVQDTIEVGGHHSSESDESILRRTSSGSSSSNSKASLRGTSFHVPLTSSTSSLETSQALQPSYTSRNFHALQRRHSLQVPQVSLPDEGQPKLEADAQPAAEVGYNGIRPQEQRNGVNALKESNADIQSGYIKSNSLDHLTPYVDGAYVYYPEYPEDEPEVDAEPDPDPDPELDPNPVADASSEVNVEASSEALPKINPNSESNPEAVPETSLKVELDTITGEVVEAAPTEEDAVRCEQADGLVGETPADTAANSPSADAEPTMTQPTEKKQFRFKQTRSAPEFTDLFTDFKSLSKAELYRRLEIANRAMVAWQDEFKELKKITDDHDNAVRYRKEEESFERRYDMAIGKNPAANPLRRDFVVKGIRAENNADPLVAYTRQQDKIMANVYGFEYDARADKMGNQDPIAQRTGLGRQGRLRERPKQTAKAAEADEPNVVQGKRNRKAPERYTGGEAASRSSTPAPTQRRGRRGAQAQENGDANQNQDQSQNQNATAPISASEPTEKETPKKKGKGGRPRKNPIPEPAPEVEPTPTTEPEVPAEPEHQPEPNPLPPRQGQIETRKSRLTLQAKGTRIVFKNMVVSAPQGDTESKPELKPSTKREMEAEDVTAAEQPTRKRRRRGPARAATPAATPAVEEDNAPNGAAVQTPKKQGRRRNSKKIESPSASFNTTTTASSSAPTTLVEESRPPTASSTATVETVASTSNYQLREKRQRKFTNDINEDDLIEEPKRKRVRRAPKKTQTKAEELTPATEPAPEPEMPPAPKPTTKIRLKVKNDPEPSPAPRPASRHASTPVSSAHSLAPSASTTPANMRSNLNGNSSTSMNTNGSVLTNGVAEPNATDGEAALEPAKDYNSMTKSEKMSASMKARWASGSMGVAVAKRRATLAAKKQIAKTPATNGATPDQVPTPTSTRRASSDGEEGYDAAATGQ
ncbi:hypothetical protein F5Y05DRAFT_418991 [Hypoxylon sp. FL0543]|nr:hypothetical protein F5Y05DRAFT_418991 [Hypoxylon sp. FL0543]